jgi:RecA-family ATPase
LSGDGGTGKTRLGLQLATGMAAEWPDWVGMLIEIHGPALVFSAEERRAQMHRIVKDILGSRGQEFSDLKHGLHFITDEDDVTLGKADRDGSVKPTRSLLRLEKTVAAIKPALVLIENASEVFVGDERVRGPVAAFVRKLLGGLTRPSNAAVALIQHPSLSGLLDGSGRSGSTAWRNAGRWQNNFTAIKPSDEEDDDGARQLHLGKVNYGKPGAKVRLQWKGGVFVPETSVSPMERAAAEAPIDDVFLKCLRLKITQGIDLSPLGGRNYAPAILADMPEAAGYKSKALAAAMERQLSNGKLATSKIGPASRSKTILVFK